MVTKVAEDDLERLHPQSTEPKKPARRTALVSFKRLSVCFRLSHLKLRLRHLTRNLNQRCPRADPAFPKVDHIGWYSGFPAQI